MTDVKVLMSKHNQIQGSILIIVLWIISISITLVAVLAKNSRLSASIVMHQQDALIEWTNMLTIINLAKMEVLSVNNIRKSPKNIFKAKNNNQNNTHKNTVFMGKKVNLSYKNNQSMIIRIYDLSGKINLSRLKRKDLKKILIKKVGAENKKVDELLDAWQDWTDSDNLKRLNGAEKAYYNQQEPPYSPRNSALQSVNELNLIKGFQGVFGNYNYSHSFTLFGSNKVQINPNIANKATLLLVPGIDENIANKIISSRESQEFINMASFNTLIPAEVASKVKGWFALSTSKYYEIIIYSKKTEKGAKVGKNGTTELYAYREIIQTLGKRNLPKTLRVFPSYKMSL